MSLNFVFKLEPIAFTVAMITTEMPAAMRPYSIAVARLVLQERNNLRHETSSMWPKPVIICTDDGRTVPFAR
jgi:hypothetical protein